MKNKIFTFWEPSKHIPSYIKLCMQTWTKFLPDYEIVVLDYSNLDEYLSKNCYDKSLFTSKYSLAKQADAIRCAVLNKHGGIWLDADSIVTSNKFNEIIQNKSDFTVIDRHIAFIKANKGAKILQLWENEARERIYSYSKYKLLSKFFDRNAYKKFKAWNYLGNGIIDKYLDITCEPIFCCINSKIIKAFPENDYFLPKTEKEKTLTYQNFWFYNDFSDWLVAENLGSLICLHNSWTPKEFRTLSEKEFLNKSCTLSKLLKKLKDI